MEEVSNNGLGFGLNFCIHHSPPAEAGSKARYRWQGAGIALGSVALGGLILHGLHTLPPPPQVVYSPPPEPYYSPPPREFVPGHLETTSEWVPGTW